MTRNLIFFFSNDCILYMHHLLLFAVCHCLKLVLFQTFVELDKKLFRLGHSSPSAWVYAFYEIETPNIVKLQKLKYEYVLYVHYCKYVNAPRRER